MKMSMKCCKAALLSAVTAFAFGAQAEVTYSDTPYDFDLTVNNIPENMASMTGDSTVYILQGGTVLAYATVSEIIGFRSGATTLNHDAATVTIGGQSYNALAHQLIEGTSIIDVGAEARDTTGFNLVFKLDSNVENPITTGGYVDIGSGNDHVYITNVDGGKGVLSAILEGQALDSEKQVVADIYERGTYLTANFSGSQYKGTTSVTVSTPEPTSAMFLLLGVAGLTLKRKRVALIKA